VIGSLEKLVSGSQFLCGSELSIADIHLAPMIGYFALFPEGMAILDRHEQLATWWSMMSELAQVQENMPRLPDCTI
jgi:glutathione S-transferase